MSDDRQPMTPTEFDWKIRRLLHICPWLSQTSGWRSEEHNAEVGGSPQSKHRVGMAIDFISSDYGLEQANETARGLGFWTEIHGEPSHLHIQGLPPGSIEEISIDWRGKYGSGNNGHDQ